MGDASHRGLRIRIVHASRKLCRQRETSQDYWAEKPQDERREVRRLLQKDLHKRLDFISTELYPLVPCSSRQALDFTIGGKLWLSCLQLSSIGKSMAGGLIMFLI